MTIAISLKVNDGLVLASDSASTLVNPQGDIIKVYNNANKIFNLKKGLPVGAITWGGGAIGPAAISTLAKDLRRRFSGHDSAHPDWVLDPDAYTIEAVATRLREFMYDELYLPWYHQQQPAPANSFIGFLVAGYSAGAPLGEEWEVNIVNGACAPPTLVRQQAECGVNWRGQPEAVHRIVLGFSSSLPSVLASDLAVPAAQLGPAIQAIQAKTQVQFIANAMPIQDAIDLAEFFVDATIKYEHFVLMPGAGTVDGPIELAAITKHEGFKWVKRKHYFSPDFNPEGDQ